MLRRRPQLPFAPARAAVRAHRSLAAVAAAVVVAVVAAVVAGCGSSTAGAGSADPAAVAPAGVPFYAEVTFRPDGGTRDDALAAAGKVLHTGDPEAGIRALLQQAFASGDTPVDFAKDIEPWLGDKAGVWFAAPARADGHPGAAAAIDVRDAALARTKLDSLLAASGAGAPVKRSASGHDYEVSSDGTAVAVVDDYAFVGTEGEVKRGLSTLDAGGDGGLAAQDAYKQAIDPLPDSRLAQASVDLKALLEQAMRADPSAASSLGPFAGALTGVMAGRPQAVAFTADGDRLTLESVGGAGGFAGQLGGLAALGSSPLLKALPADAWAALAVPRLGSSLRTAFSQVAGAFGGAAITQSLRNDAGIDLEQDVFSWIGDAGVFVRGTSPSTVDGAIVLEATDADRATAAFGKFVGLARTRGGVDPQPVRVPGADAAFSFTLPNAPKPAVLARGNGRVVAALGTAAAAEGISASHPVGDSDTFSAARDAIDGLADPAAFLSVARVLQLAEAAGAGSDPDYAKARSSLEAFDVVAEGSKRDGETVRTRLSAGLR